MVPMVRLILILDRLAVRSGTMSLTSPVRVPQCLGPDVLAPLHLHPGCEAGRVGLKASRVYCRSRRLVGATSETPEAVSVLKF